MTVAGCGDDDDQSAEIRDAIETVVSSRDPANCSELQTLRFTGQVEFEPTTDQETYGKPFQAYS